jgi:hypothetical protein
MAFVDDLSGVLNDAVAAVEYGAEYLGRAGDAARGQFPRLAEKIRAERASLDVLRMQLVRTRNGRGASLVAAAGGPKQQIPAIYEARDRIKEMASDTDTPAEVGGYMEMCVDCLNQAMAFMSELP